jgi:hypothetical protein
MKSLIASLRSLTLPFGATTGARIVLDSVSGTITIFDSSNNERIVLGGPIDTDLLQISTGDIDEAFPAILDATTSGDLSERLDIRSPAFANDDFATIRLASGSKDSTVGNAVHVLADDLLLNGFSLPRGILARVRRTSNVVFSTETQVHQLPEVTLLADRRYRLSFSWRSMSWNTTVAAAIVALRIKDLASTQRCETSLLLDGATGRAGGTCETVIDCPGEIGSGAHTFEATATRVTGAGTDNLEASGTTPSVLYVEDVGSSL